MEKQAATCKGTAISNFSVHITSSESVTVYALNQSYRTTDATNVLPITALGTNYYHISYATISMASYDDAYGVIATQNNTRVYHNGVLSATLNMGGVYYRTNSNDMTGAHITSDKPIAFFALHQGPQIPTGTPFVDILFQQLAPINTWGKTFFVPVSWRGRDFVRVLASENGTNITQIGGTIRWVSGGQTTLTNLNAGQWVEMEVTLANKGCYIQANKPVGVCAYLTGGTYNTILTGDSTSDPAQAWLPSIEQKIKTALIAPFIPNGESNLSLNKGGKHFALVITPTDTKDSTTVKIGNGTEQTLSGGMWYDNPAAGMSFYSYPLTNQTSAYLFTNREGGLIIMGYGTGTAESYYYLSSSGMRTLGAEFFVNDINYQDLTSAIVCTQPIQFRARIEGDMSTDPGHLKWYIDSVEEIPARDQLTWSKPLAAGTYHLKMEATMENNIITRTVEATLTIVSVEITNLSGKTTICVADNIFLEGNPYGGTWESVNPTTATVNSNGEVSGISAGSVEIRYIFNSIGCVDSASVMLKITLPTVEATTTPEICGRENGTAALTVYNCEKPSTLKYSWEGISDTTYLLANSKAGTYKATISDSFCVVEKTVTIDYIDGPIANFEPNVYHLIKGMTFVLTDLSQGTVQSRHWDMGDGNTQAGQIVNYTYSDTGIYTVLLEVFDINNCTDTMSKVLQVHDNLRIFIPNTFTPNGDGINDTWKPVILDYLKTGYQLSIFDRWGQRIFQTTDTEDEWDGTLSGQPAAPNTVYSYSIIVQDIAGKEHKFTGSIKLVR